MQKVLSALAHSSAIFTNKQLGNLLRATFLEEPVLCATIVMDVTQLHADIRTALPSDPAAVSGIASAKSDTVSRWTIDDTGLLRLNDCIYVPLSEGSDSLR